MTKVSFIPCPQCVIHPAGDHGGICGTCIEVNNNRAGLLGEPRSARTGFFVMLAVGAVLILAFQKACMEPAQARKALRDKTVNCQITSNCK
jgi:hypothetical protein